VAGVPSGIRSVIRRLGHHQKDLLRPVGNVSILRFMICQIVKGAIGRIIINTLSRRITND
jgi:hypothetical protein